MYIDIDNNHIIKEKKKCKKTSNNAPNANDGTMNITMIILTVVRNTSLELYWEDGVRSEKGLYSFIV